ncbi:MAG: flavin reductase family protein [Bacteroidetes bacterium]|nr:flavin reductase family protein [Bacteroidota bacterium]
MITKDISKFYQFYPCNVTLVGARKGNRVNFMAAAWNVGLSFNPPPFGVSISPKRFTHDMIVKSGEFTCNFLPIENIDIIHGTGRTSGRDYDKVELFSIPLEKPQVIDCPTIESAYAAYECRLVHQYPVGDHNFFVGKVVAVHYNNEVITQKGLLNTEKINFAMYLGSNTYISTDPGTMRLLPAEIEVPVR